MKYRPAVDLLRLLAATSIVCFHASGSPWKRITITGLAFFILLTFTLQGSAEVRQAFPGFVRKRARKLLVPWVAWSLFYSLISFRGNVTAAFSARSLLTGPAIHLWFLPFAFLGAIVVYPLDTLARKIPARWSVGGLCALAASLAAAASWFPEHLVSPWGQWLYAAPLMPLGLAMGVAQRTKSSSFLAIICAIAAGVSSLRDDPSYFLGAVLLATALVARPWSPINFKELANLSMGIYLLHPFFFLLVYKFSREPHWVALLLAGLLGSAIASAIIVRLPKLSGLTFGT